MAIKNFQCQSCGKTTVCKIYDIIAKFSEEAKKPLGVDLQLLSCENYEGSGEVYDEV